MLPLLLLSSQRSQAITGDDGSLWVQASPPGFGSDDNMSVVAMAEYSGYLYAMTRNQQEGTEVWRTSGTGWEQVLFPGGETNGVYGNAQINNVWARMIVFQNKLYFGLSSGLQGNFLGSTGAEIWRYDGSTWEPVISDKRDIDESGTITGIAGCADGDGVRTAQISDSTKAWTTDEWAGGVLQITSGTGIYRKFLILSNTADTLTIQQNETAGTYNTSGAETEYTNCSSKVYNNPFPLYSYTLGAVAVGDAYEIGMDEDENGFGDFWNKTITAMRIFDDKLYVSTGLNYEYGGQIWYTENGDDWFETPSIISIPAPYNYHSFGNFHSSTFYPGGYKPVSSSVTELIVSSVSGTPVLYAGGTGTTGNLGGCSRMARLTGSGWELIVDNGVDGNTTGSNENGFGSPSGCGTNQYNFLPWSFADFNNYLLVAISGDGSRVISAPTGLTDIQDDGSWQYSVGVANVDPGDPLYVDPLGSSSYPNGFDGYQYPTTVPGFGILYQNIAANLFPFNSVLYGGIICQYVPEYDIPVNSDELLGSQIWKTSDAVTWTQVTGNGFGDDKIINFEAFAAFGSHLYASGSKGASSTPSGLGGAKVFKQLNGLPDDLDEDGVSDSADNCDATPNGSSLGTCTSGYRNVICTSNAHCGTGGVCSTAQEDGDSDGVGNACDNCSALANPGQEDTFPPGGNGCGNACECEGNFDGDGDQDGTDAATFKADFGRNALNDPCNNSMLCNGDFTCNGNVDGSDAALFKADFGRNALNNGCPAFETARWCWY
jgi:hypothetical protein